MCFFLENDNLGLKTKILKFLGIQSKNIDYPLSDWPRELSNQTVSKSLKVESILFHKKINTADIANNAELAIAISITQSLVNFTIATQNSENKLQIYNSTQLSSRKLQESSEIALVEGRYGTSGVTSG